MSIPGRGSRFHSAGDIRPVCFGFMDDVPMAKNNTSCLRILVCIKQVPDMDAPVAPDESGLGAKVGGRPSWRMNRYDEYAMEEALRIREARPGTTISALSVGPGRVAQVLKRALELGADEGIHVATDHATDDGRMRPPLETAGLIACWARDRRFDLILAGTVAEDDLFGQVGPLVASLLDVPCATSAMALQLAENRIRVERELEGGAREAFSILLPALVSVQSGINRPRYPALSHVLRARSQPLVTIRAEDLPRTAPRERLLRLCAPDAAPKGAILTGTPSEKAERLARALHQRGLL